MRFPLHITTDMVKHQVKNAIKGNSRFPFVLMLEPLYLCNLKCMGCAPERNTGKLDERIPLEKCIEALDDCQAPVVSLCGGEPTLYPELPELVQETILRKRHIYLCTNAQTLDDKLFGKIPPHKRLSLNVHLDGTKSTHDKICQKQGVFEKALTAIKEARKRGYHITTNTTVYRETDIDDIENLCEILSSIGTDGILISPGYHYETSQRKIFLTKSEIQEKFKKVIDLSKKYNITSTPMFLEFAAGMREYRCSPWSTATYTPKGWKRPCYLAGNEYTDSWDDFWNKTDWNYWENATDPRCQNCAMHSGYEASVVMNLPKRPMDILKIAYWNFLG